MENVILAVEDNEADQAMIRETISRSLGDSVKLVFCPTIRCAREEFAQRSIDVVLLDLGLPDAHGVQAVREVREIKPDVPIIIFTGGSDETVRLQSIAGGALQFISKSEGFASLPAAILAGLEVRRRKQVTVEAFSARLESIYSTTQEIREDQKRVARAQETEAEERREIKEALFGTEREPEAGLLYKVNQNAGFIAITKRVSWAILIATATAVVTAVVGVIFAFFQ